jgi:hypothetical protein
MTQQNFSFQILFVNLSLAKTFLLKYFQENLIFFFLHGNSQQKNSFNIDHYGNALKEKPFKLHG